MNKLKKIIFALAAVVSLGLVGASNAYAQADCPVSAVPVVVRDKGLTELTGNIVLGSLPGNPCTGVIPVGGIQLTITIQPATANITNATGTTPTAVVVGVTNAAPGTLVAGTISANTVTFNIPADAGLQSITIGVGTAVAGMTGIRVNVAASGIAFPGVIQGFITSSPAGILSLRGNVNTVTIATPQPGLAATFTAGTGVAQCLPRAVAAALTTVFTNLTALGAQPVGTTYTTGTTGATSAPTGVVATSISRIVATEGFASAFAVAGASPGEGTDASQGTRLLIRLTDVSTNMSVLVPQLILTSTATGTLAITLVTGADANGGGGALVGAPVGGTANSVAVTSGAATIVYQVTAATPGLTEALTIPIAFYTFGTPSAAITTASIALAPISTLGTAAALSATAAPIPRFIDNPFSGPAVTVTICQTNILFPYITNVLGYDVGLAIANTTSDSPVFGTASQTGTCVYNFYGTNAPAGGTFTTPAFAGGVTDARLLSSMAPSFTGYAIAQCNFQLGHGFFFIVYNLGTSAGVAQGSPALIIPQPVSPATRSSIASTPGAGGIAGAFAEALGH